MIVARVKHDQPIGNSRRLYIIYTLDDGRELVQWYYTDDRRGAQTIADERIAKLDAEIAAADTERVIQAEIDELVAVERERIEEEVRTRG
jgi:predicted HTH domain antitoxin